MLADNSLFIRDWNTKPEPYAALRKNSSVHNPQAMQEGFGSFDGFEAVVGKRNTIDASLLAILGKYRKAVCRIVCEGTNFDGISDSWKGTGFLVGPNLIVTNHHVLNSPTVAASARLDFEYERTPQELAMTSNVGRHGRRELSLDPSRLFITSPARGGLDYTFVWIDDETVKQYGHIPMSRGSFVSRLHEPLFVIHHPKGDFKQASVDDTELLNADGDLLLYAADTEGGSSGAPVISRNGKLCGLHHAFAKGADLVRKHAKRIPVLQDGNRYTIANEGIKFSAIALDLERRLESDGLRRNDILGVLDQFTDSDSMTGPYGARGRVLERTSEEGPRINDTYLATEQDLDIAVWNLEWLNAHAADAAALKRAARVLADITQDIWILDGISRETVEGLHKTFQEVFEQDYEFVFADDETHPAQPLTALLYNKQTVTVTRQDWPNGIADLWRTKAGKDLKLATLNGPIFPSFPAWINVSIKGRTNPVNLNLVPLFVRKGANANLRQSVAALIMERVLERMLSSGEAQTDWLVVGDLNTPLRQTRIEMLGERDFASVLVMDRHRGGFSYLRGNESALSQLFVPTGTERIRDDQGLVTEVDKVFQGRFADALSSTLPYGVRLSLISDAEATDLETTKDILGAATSFAAASSLEASSQSSWRWKSLSKPQFMAANANRMKTMIESVNNDVAGDYPGDYVPLALQDFYVLIYCEAGFSNGSMDAEATHSLGEKGLLPLPSNLSFWLGSNAPAHSQLLSLEKNIHYYGHYLARVKNKAVKSTSMGTLYRDLFRDPLIGSSELRQAKVLAGIIHGYFLDMNYRNGRKAELEDLLQAYRADTPIPEMLADSGYVHDGTSILKNRERNVLQAITDFQTQN